MDDFHSTIFCGTPARGVVALLVIAGLLSSCTSSVQPTTTANDMLQSALDTEVQTSPEVPGSVAASLLAAGNANATGTGEERFDVSVSSGDARVFFLSLVNGTGINLVVHPEVQGQISLELKDVTVREVLEVTRRIYGYEFSVDNGIYTVLPRTLRTEVFPINYLDVVRSGNSETSIVINNIVSSNDNGNSGGSNSNAYQDNQNSQQTIPSGARIKTTTEANFWHSLEVSLRAIVGADQAERLVMVNARTGIVVVRALPTELAAVRDFLHKSQLSAVRQVVLETKIIEVQLNDTFQAGINWSTIEGALVGTFERVREQAVDTLSTTTSSLSAVIGVSDISSLLGLLEMQGEVNILSSPRVSTVNNQKAIIRVGSDEFFVTGISNSMIASAATVTNTPNIELSSFFSGIALDVTPQIAENGDVILHVHPVISEVQDQVKDLTVGDEQFSLPLAFREIRESDSIVRAKSNQVIVLGGLMQEVSRRQGIDRPGLSDVPILKWFFKARNDLSRKTELVILMRPVVTNDDTWAQDINAAQQRVRQLQ